MLTRSPVLASPANSSPRSGFAAFHYAPAPSPRQSPARVSAALSRRQSTPSPSGSLTSRPSTQTKRYVGVDAATQYSPIEPIDYATGMPLNRPSEGGDTPMEAPPAPAPKPKVLADTSLKPGMVPEQPSGSIPGKSVPTKATPASSRSVAAARDTTQPLSPSKRRNSDGPSGFASALTTVEQQSSSALAKRPKPDMTPPKVLPQRYELCAVEDVVVLIAHMLGELIETNDALALKSGHLTRFHSRTAPGISVLDYLHRLAKHATLTPPLLLSMVYYIDRLCSLYPEFTINTLTVHRFLITAATVAAKGLSDSFWNNSTYARVGGVRVAELKLLELEFLYRVDWKIVPNPEVLVAYYRGLVERCPGYKLEQDESSVDEDDDSETVEDGDDEASSDENENNIDNEGMPKGNEAQQPGNA